MIYPIITKCNLRNYRLSPYTNYAILEDKIIFVNSLYNTKVIFKVKKSVSILFIDSLEEGTSLKKIKDIIEKLTHKNHIDSTIRTLFQQHILE
jgi:hypothetical protein